MLKPRLSVVSGEEEETTLIQMKAGLLYLDKDTNQYDKRAFGVLKLNVRKIDGKGARLRQSQRL